MVTITKHEKGFGLIETIIVLIIVMTLGVVGYVIYKHHQQTTVSIKNAVNSSTLQPPRIPTFGAYLGAWPNPSPDGQKTKPNVEKQLPILNQTIGRQLKIEHLFTGWSVPAPVSEINFINQNGGMTLVDWGPANYATISGGSDDSVINNYANALKSYGKPVFLRWDWEMNLKDPSHVNEGSSIEFIAAWQHIYELFQKDGATNVTFVWCPGISGGLSRFSSWYPGSQYVNWIAVDGYDHHALGAAGFSNIFGAWYDQYSSYKKPLMIAETGAQAVDQAAYLQGLESSVQQYTGIKAVVYFDSTGTSGQWTLTGTGLTQFTQMAQSSYFNPNE